MAKSVPPSIRKLEPTLQLILRRALGPGTSSHQGPSVDDVSMGKVCEASFATSAAGRLSGRRSLYRLPSSGSMVASAADGLQRSKSARRSVSKMDPSFYLAPLKLGRGSGGTGDGEGTSPASALRSRKAPHSISGASASVSPRISEGRKSRRSSASFTVPAEAPAGRLSMTAATIVGVGASSPFDRQLRRAVTLGVGDRPAGAASLVPPVVPGAPCGLSTPATTPSLLVSQTLFFVWFLLINTFHLSCRLEAQVPFQ